MLELWKRRRIQSLAEAQAIRQSTDGQVNYLPIPGFPQHRVGDDGTVWVFRWDRKERGRWRQIKGTKVKGGGYRRVDLGNGSGKTTLVFVHRLVLTAFKGPCPSGREACHRDDDPENNRLTNLRWGTRESNWKDRKRNRVRRGLHYWTTPGWKRKRNANPRIVV